MKAVIQFFISISILVLIVFGVLHLMDREVGQLMDWVIGLAIFFWLMVIVTVPWNAHFKAKEVLDDAAISKRKDILVVEDSLAFAQRLAKRSLFIAIALHLVSAIGLWAIAPHLSITALGHFGALAALLLTVLRPSVRFYEYINRKLSAIKQEFRYPRQDMHELLNDVEQMKVRLQTVETDLSTDPEVVSWRKEVMNTLRKVEHKLGEQETELSNLEDSYKQEFKAVRSENRDKLAKITSDSKVLDSVREIASFLKQIR